MSLLVLQHHPEEHAARLGQTLRDHGHRLRVIRLDLNQSLPPDLDDVEGLVIMGGPQNVDEVDQYPWLADEMELIRKAKAANLPMVGICLGAQLIAKALGGEVAAMPAAEAGFGLTKLTMPKFVDPVLQGIRWQFMQFHMHGQEVTKLPPDSAPLCFTDKCKIQAYRTGLNIYCFQFHFELDKALIEKFSHFATVTKAGLDSATILQQMEEHYDEYRRISERLCENIATLLLPVDRKVATPA
jgi:GMP synthase (glutamine-hydrolysing)